MNKYNLYEITEILKDAGIQHPFVYTVLFDRYSINSTDNICYPALVFIKDNIQTGRKVSTATWSVIYVDRLNAERDNAINIQSVGTQVISEVMNAVYDNFDIDPTSETITVNYFTDGYADNVAGAISNNVSFNFASDISDCYDYCVDSCLKNE